jgi:UDP-2,4-diacetamido-2,4,6-trideoxy-beta-L-altropyranose hydrolase
MKIIARLDADSIIGAGHLMRVLTLLNQLVEQSDYYPHDVLIVSYSLSDSFKSLITHHGFRYHVINQVDNWSMDYDAQTTAELIGDDSIADLVIVDHYELDKTWETQLTPYCHQLIVIDDLANREHHCTTLIDQTLGRKKDDYSDLVPSYCKLLLGTKYTMLRPEFQRLRITAKQTQSNSIKNILIAFGATDPQGNSNKVVAWLAQLLKTKPQMNFHCTIMITSASPHLNNIKKTCDMYPWLSCTIDEKNVAELLLKTNLAIGASGSASWERCCLGVPTIAFQTADNQKMLLAELDKAGAIANLKELTEQSQDEFNQSLSRLIEDTNYYTDMRRNSFNVCDGTGANLICDHLLSNTLKLRLATKKDEDLLYQWQSNPHIRQFFRNPNAVTFNEHTTWFRNSLKLSSRTIYVIELGSNANTLPVGTLRFDEVNSQQYEVSILIDHKFQNRKLGWRALKSTPNKFRNKEIIASVHTDNKASQQLFLSAGYSQITNNLFLLKNDNKSCLVRSSHYE